MAGLPANCYTLLYFFTFNWQLQHGIHFVVDIPTAAVKADRQKQDTYQAVAIIALVERLNSAWYHVRTFRLLTTQNKFITFKSSLQPTATM